MKTRLLKVSALQDSPHPIPQPKTKTKSDDMQLFLTIVRKSCVRRVGGGFVCYQEGLEGIICLLSEAQGVAVKFLKLPIRRYDLVVGLYIFGVMVAELMGAKTFPLFTIGHQHFNASVAIFVLPLLYSLTDVVVEVHGKARARSLVYTGIAMIALLIAYATLATSLPPTMRYAGSEAAYDQIFHASIRISAASLTAFALAELFDIAVFSKLRQRMHKKALWLRTNLSNFLSFFIDSAVFLTLAFYAFGKPLGDNVSFLISLLLPYWFLKCLMSVAATPLVYAGVRWLRTEKTR
jgi:uncharacterized integral membrane protein (TIGR00697 family)